MPRDDQADTGEAPRVACNMSCPRGSGRAHGGGLVGRIAKNAIGGRCRRRGAAGARPVRARQNGLRTRSRENALNGAPTPIRYVSNRSCRAETGALTTPWNGPIALPEMAKLRGPAAELVQSRSGATALAGTCGLAERSPGLRCPHAIILRSGTPSPQAWPGSARTPAPPR